jgi:hypothetical protein
LVQNTNERDSPETIAHNVKDVATACNEEQLHDEVVQRNPAEQQVEIARHENASIKGLCFEGYTWASVQLVHLERWVLPDLDMTASFAFYAPK